MRDALLCKATNTRLQPQKNASNALLAIVRATTAVRPISVTLVQATQAMLEKRVARMYRLTMTCICIFITCFFPTTVVYFIVDPGSSLSIVTNRSHGSFGARSHVSVAEHIASPGDDAERERANDAL